MVNANRLRAALLLGLVVAFGLCMYCMALVSSLDSCKSAHEELVDREGELAVCLTAAHKTLALHCRI